MLTIEEAMQCNNIEDLNNLAVQQGFNYFWQKQLPDTVFTYDKMSDGFFDNYYGKDMDLRCPIAWAFRSRKWPVFSFYQAFDDARFNQACPQLESKDLWLSNGIKDGLLILSGRPKLDSFAVFAFPEKVENPQEQALPYIALTHKLDNWLEHRTDLNGVKREFKALSPKESETLKVQVNYPHFSIKEQAEMLGVSELTLATRHERIAKKFGVKRFAGAALLAERTGFFAIH